MILRDGSDVEDPRLDRVVSATTEHIDRYPLTLATMPVEKTAMVAGINWYSGFDRPTKRRIEGHEYDVIGDGDIGRVRGGHAVCLPHWALRDSPLWWLHYNQGNEGRCVEFATNRAMTLHNRVRYDTTSRWPYQTMQRMDEWPGGTYPGAVPQYEGTSVRAGLEYMRTYGPIRARLLGRSINAAEAPALIRPDDGIAAYRWATDWSTVRTALGVPGWMPGVPLLNSWGRGYPRRTILLDAAGERVLREDGELGMISDR